MGTLPALHLASVFIDQQGLAINSDNQAAFADADIPIGGYHMTSGEVTVSAAALSYHSTIGLALLAAACIVLLAIMHLPLPWLDGEFVVDDLFVAALAVALILAIIFLTFYVYRVAEESRRLSDALALIRKTGTNSPWLATRWWRSPAT